MPLLARARPLHHPQRGRRSVRSARVRAEADPSPVDGSRRPPDDSAGDREAGTQADSVGSAMPRRDLVLRSAFCVAVFLIAACAAASPTSTLSSAHGITLAKVDGGPRYYARFSHGLPTRASYFPIGVWFESIVSRADIHKDKKAGLNLYVALVKNSVTEGPLASLRPNGMRAILQDDWTGYAPARRNPAVVGWELADEIDMQQANGQGAAAARAKLNQFSPDDSGPSIGDLYRPAFAFSGDHSQIPHAVILNEDRGGVKLPAEKIHVDSDVRRHLK